MPRLEIPPLFWQKMRREWQRCACPTCCAMRRLDTYPVQIVYYGSYNLRTGQPNQIELASLTILFSSDEDGMNIDIDSVPGGITELSLLLNHSSPHTSDMGRLSNFFQCRRCNNFTIQSDESRGLCSSCYETYRVCISCETLCTADNTETDTRGRAICARCSSNFFICRVCGHWTHRENAWTIEADGALLCGPCGQRGSTHIASYGTTPFLCFLAKEGEESLHTSIELCPTLFLGVELETDRYPDSTDRNKAADTLGERDPDRKLYWLTTDSTLRNGFEIISQPATLEFHKSEFPWEEITSTVKNHNGHSSSTETCGLHIHFNKTFFGNDEDTVDLVTMKLLYLIEHFWAKWVKFSRRSREQLNHYANRYNAGFKDMPLAKIKEMKYNAGRYRAINIGNEKNTIEVRLFHGTLDVNIIYACLELVDFLARYCKDTTAADIYGQTWYKLVRSIPKSKYPYLVAFLKKQDLRSGKKKEGKEEANVPDNLQEEWPALTSTITSR